MRWLLLLISITSVLSIKSQSLDCFGGEVYTADTFQYGRFEVSMRSVGEEGVVSSFFMYNLGAGCNWPEENNEIDIEMTGNNENLQFTTHYPSLTYHTDIYTPSFNPHDSLHEYAIEWEPGIVRWFVDGQLVNVQNQNFVSELKHGLNVMMNLWAAEAVGWVGNWDPSVMPQESVYDYVAVYDYTPGQGSAGTDSNFTQRWFDDFDEFDSQRWIISRNKSFDGNYCEFSPLSVRVENGLLFLTIQEPQVSDPVSVTFSVNTVDESLAEDDVIYLNGTFNNWCGTCEPMTQQDGVWSVELELEPGSYEYLFVKNDWEELGGAPQGSECDYRPCDEWLNYGFDVSDGDQPITLRTYCWNECTDCAAVGMSDILFEDKRPVRYFDLYGRVVSLTSGQLLIVEYDDRTFGKVFANP